MSGYLENQRILPLFFSSNGKISRSLFWKANILLFLLYLIFVFCLVFFAMVLKTSSDIEVAILFLGVSIYWYGAFALTVKRLHDINWSGWLAIPVMLTGIVWIIVGLIAGKSNSKESNLNYSINREDRKSTNLISENYNKNYSSLSQEDKLIYAANNGNIEAKLSLAEMYGNGQGENYEQGVATFRLDAEQGNVRLQFTLGLMYRLGRGVEQNDVLAINWFNKAAEQNFAPAQYWLGTMYANGLGVNQSEQQAIAWYEKSAEQGNYGAKQALNNIRESIDNKIELPAENDLLENKTEEEIYALAQAGNAEAQTLIGLTYMTNGSLANNEDDKKAFHWLSLAADQNYPQALMWVASYYQNGGRGNWLPTNINKAIELYERAAKLGDSVAQTSLGDLFYEGKLVPQDIERAKYWFEQAGDHDLINGYTESGDISSENEEFHEAIALYQKTLKKDPDNIMALIEIGNLYYDELEDYPKAFEYFNRTLKGNMGPFIAEAKLGLMYYSGIGIEQDYEKAFELLSRAAEKSYVDEPILGQVQSVLGLMYYDGNFVDKDYDVAFEFFSLAAERENIKAYYYLGKMYDKGNSVEQSSDQALMWYLLAAEKGDVDAQNLLGEYLIELGRYEEALTILHRAADNNCRESQFQIGCIYYFGKGVEVDYYEAFQWYEKAAINEHSQAQYNLGVMYAEGKGVVLDFTNSFKWHYKAAENGYVEAQFILGFIYINGRGVDKNYDEAYKWTLKAANEGHKKAKVNLGVLYYNGFGIDKNYNLALSCLDESVKEGDDLAINIIVKMAKNSFYEAQEYLGLMYYEGYGVEEDIEEAFHWFKSAAKQDFKHPKSKYYLGMMYQYGYVVEEDTSIANEWFLKAFDIFNKDCGNGDLDAKYYLALMFYEGYGVNKDLKKSFKFFYELAISDYVDAQYYLGLMYYNGDGVSKDYKECLKWYCKAAEQGDIDAQFSLGNMYYYGEGVNLNYEKALDWYSEAAEQGHEEAFEMMESFSK